MAFKAGRVLDRIMKGEDMPPYQIEEYLLILQTNLATKKVDINTKATWIVTKELLEEKLARQNNTEEMGINHHKVQNLKNAFSSLNKQTINFHLQKEYINPEPGKTIWFNSHIDRGLIHKKMEDQKFHYKGITYEIVNYQIPVNWFNELEILKAVNSREYIARAVTDTKRLSTLQSFFLQDYFLPTVNGQKGWYYENGPIEKGRPRNGKDVNMLSFPEPSTGKDLILMLNGQINDRWDKSFVFHGIKTGKNGTKFATGMVCKYKFRNSVLSYTTSKSFIGE